MPLTDSLRLRAYLPVVVGAGAAACLIAAYYRLATSGGRRPPRRRIASIGSRKSGGNAEALMRLLLDAGPEEVAEHTDEPVVCQFGDTTCRLVVRDRRSVLQKLQSVAQDGIDNLEVITDFDHTLSKFAEHGRRMPSCHGILESYPDLSPEDHQYFKQLFEKYYAIEICPSMSEEEKIPHMIEWWSRSHDRMVQAGFQRAVLAHTVDMSGVALRDGWRQFFDCLIEHSVPCLIFSAGIGDIIQEILRHFDIKGKLIRVVSNFMLYDDKDLLRGFTEPLIHTFNKRFSAFARLDADAAAEADCRGRRNVLLMGDTTGDLRMAEGCHAGLVLTVGYLNDKVAARLPSYAASYDIVCLEDPTLCVPLAVLEVAGRGASF